MPESYCEHKSVCFDATHAHPLSLSPLSLFPPPVLAHSPFASHVPLYPEGIPREEIFFIDVILFSVMSALAGMGVILTFACLLFNLIFMRKK